MKTVIRHYLGPDRKTATLTYTGDGRQHRVTAYRAGRVCEWACDDVTEARQRWSLLVADLTAGLYRPAVK